MKKIAFIVIALLLLAAGGLGGAAMLGMGPLAPLFGKQRDTPAAPPPPKHRVITLGTYIIPIVQNHAIRRQIAMDLDIDVNGTAVEKAQARMTPLKQAILLKLYDILPRHSDAHSSADREVIHDQLLKVATDVVGEGAVRDVVIKSIYDR